MSKLSFDAEAMRWMSLFESITQARLKDCFKDGDVVMFVVLPGYMAKAIGKKGVNVKKIQGLFKKDVRIIEYQPTPEAFVKGQIQLPVDVQREGNNVVITCPDIKTKGQVFGREKERYKRLQALVEKYFPGIVIVVK